MKRKPSINFLILLFTVLFIEGCNVIPNQKPIKHRLIYNSDGTNVLWNGMFNRPLSVADVKAYVDTVANTQVTTFMICSGCDFPYYRSKYGRVFGDDRNGILDCGDDTTTYKRMVTAYHNHLNLEKEGTDIVEISLKRAKEEGMEAFISYRINDLHFADTSSHCPITNTDYWLKHPQYWLNENVGWHSKGAFDFAHKEVRERKLGIITEQLEKYGEFLDGYDLDFMRFIVYFKSNEAKKNAPLMTELVKAVRAEVDKQSEKYGKKILLSARVPTSVEDCLKKGLDIKEWVNKGLIDFVSIGVHFIGNPAIPVGKFKTELGNPDFPVYTTIENGGYSPREPYSHGMCRGMASHILAKGGDGVYLFNYFITERLSLEEGGQVCRIIDPDLLQEIGSLETLRSRNKIYCLDDGTVQYGLRSDTPLPLSVSNGSLASANIYIGDDLQKDKPEERILFIRTDKAANCSLSVNGTELKVQKPEYIHLYDRGNNLEKDEAVYAYIIPASCLKQGDNKVTFKSDENESFSAKRLEVALKYGDVETHGYF